MDDARQIDTKTESGASRRVELTDEQQMARERAVKLLLGRAVFNGSKLGRLIGSAGSGKTTVTRAILDDIEDDGYAVLPPGGYDRDEHVPAQPHIALLSPTNRAARRATQVTGRPFSTIHRFAYRAEETRTARGQELAALLKDIESAAAQALERRDQGAVDEASREAARVRLRLRYETRIAWVPNPQADLAEALLCDEGSMVGVGVWGDVPDRRSLLVGDPFQLPPVMDSPVWCGAGWVTIGALRQVHRHGGPIREFAEALRGGADPATLHSMDTGIGGLLRVQPQPHLDDLDIARALAGFDAILVGRHSVRRKLNLRARSHLFDIPLDHDGRMEIGALTPRVGDRIVIRQNARDLGLLNGDAAKVLSVEGEVGLKRQLLVLGLQPLDEANQPLGEPLFGVECDPSSLQQYALEPLNAKPLPPKPRGALLIDFGAAMTVHAMQGSEAPRVLVLGNSSVGEGRELMSWRYTAASRAQHRLVYLAGAAATRGCR